MQDEVEEELLGAAASVASSVLVTAGDVGDEWIWQTSPQGIVECTSIQTILASSKARLALHLNNRPSLDDLRHKGVIYPFDVNSPTEAEQKRKTMRAQTSEQLQWKIQQRPDRRTLVDHHILMDTASNPGVSPILHEAQEQLKKKKLRDELNSKLAVRPGALEVAEKGYLPLSMGAHSLLKDGCIPFTKVADGMEDSLAQLESAAPDDSPPSEEFNSPPASVSATVALSVPSPPSSTVASSVTLFNASAALAPSPAYVLSPVASTTASSAPRKRPSGYSKLGRKSAANQRIEKFGMLTFHRYVPPGGERLTTANRCREDQQRMYLRMEAERSRLMDELREEVAGPTGATSAVSSSAVASRLEQQLSATQLRAECRKRGLKRSGNKEQLAALLEPYRLELAATYGFPGHARPSIQSDSSVSSAAAELAATTSATAVVSAAGLHTSNSSPNLARSSSEGAHLHLRQLQHQQQFQQHRHRNQQQLAYCLVPLFLNHPTQPQPRNQRFPTVPTASFVVRDLRPSIPSSSTGDLRTWLTATQCHPQAQSSEDGCRVNGHVPEIDLIDQLIDDAPVSQLPTATVASVSTEQFLRQQQLQQFNPHSPMRLDDCDDASGDLLSQLTSRVSASAFGGDPPLMPGLAPPPPPPPPLPQPLDSGFSGYLGRTESTDMEMDLDLNSMDYIYSMADSVFAADT